jgi:hypothetical protein
VDIQEIIAFVILAIAVAYLLRKYFLRRKAAGNCGTMTAVATKLFFYKQSLNNSLWFNDHVFWDR